MSEKECYGEINCPNCGKLTEYWLFDETSDQIFELVYCRNCKKVFLAYPNEVPENEDAPWQEDEDENAYEEWGEIIGV